MSIHSDVALDLKGCRGNSHVRLVCELDGPNDVLYSAYVFAGGHLVLVARFFDKPILRMPPFLRQTDFNLSFGDIVFMIDENSYSAAREFLENCPNLGFSTDESSPVGLVDMCRSMMSESTSAARAAA